MSNKFINNICITSGNLGINTINPLFPVHLTGINDTSGILYCNNTSGTTISLGYQVSYSATIAVLQNSTKANNTNALIEFGKTPLSNYNMAQVYYCNVASSSTSNNMRMGIYSSPTHTSFLGNGSVGIGTASPNCPLHIAISMSQTVPTVYYMNYNGTATTGNAYAGGGSGSYGIYASQRILTYSYFLATSDKRIKKDIIPIDTLFALDAINKLNPVKYEYIDKVSNSHATLGFIAQEVDSTIQNIVSKVKDYIPNIFSLAQVQNDILILQNEINQNTNGSIYDIKINVGDNLKLYKSDDSSVIVKIVEIIDNLTIRIDQIIDDTSVVVYGTEKSDFNVLSYNSLFSVSIAALKELDKQIQENMLIEQEIESLITDIKTCLESQ